MEKHNQTQHSGTSPSLPPLPPPPPPTPPDSQEIIIQINNKDSLQSPPPSSSSSSLPHLQSHPHHTYHPYPQPQPQPPSPQLQSQGSRIVHIPVDQLYRPVLPNNPNNNNNPLTSHHRSSSYNAFDQTSNSGSHHGRSCFSSSFFSCFLLIFTVIIVVLVIAACIFYLVLNPRNPRFFIENLTLKYPSSSSSSQSSSSNLYHLVSYNLSMEANNPNSHLGFYYLEGGSASLFYEKQEMANGKPPQFYNGKKDNRVFHLVLKSSSKVWVKEFAEIIMKDDDKYSNVKIPLVLLIRTPMKIKLGKLKLWKMNTKITCDVSVYVSSKNNVRLGSQRCKNTIH